MPENLVEKLRLSTESAVERQQTAEMEEQREEAKRAQREKRRFRSEVKQFVGQQFEARIGEVTQHAEQAANGGKTEAQTVWRIRRGERDPEPTEELAKYRALRSKVAEHFTELQFHVEEIDARDGYEDRRGSSDEGWYPYVHTDHLIGLTVSWDHPEE